MTTIEVAAKWKAATERYAAQFNAYVEMGTSQGWHNAGPKLNSAERDLPVESVLEVSRRANEQGAIEPNPLRW